MLRRSSILLIVVGLLIAWSFAMNVPASASPQAQATATMDHDTNTNGDEEHSENGMDMGDEHDEDMEMGGPRLDPGNASIRILAPADGASLTGSSVTVKVETTNFELGQDGNHFHLYVDGKEQGMSQGNSDAIAANDLEPGEHTIEVVLTNGLHQEFDAVASITIHVEGELQQAASSAPSDNSLLIVGAVVLAIAVVGGVGYVATRRK